MVAAFTSLRWIEIEPPRERSVILCEFEVRSFFVCKSFAASLVVRVDEGLDVESMNVLGTKVDECPIDFEEVRLATPSNRKRTKTLFIGVIVLNC